MGENSLILATLVPCVAALPIRNSDELHLNNALLFPGSDEQFSLTQLSRGTTYSEEINQTQSPLVYKMREGVGDPPGRADKLLRQRAPIVFFELALVIVSTFFCTNSKLS
jgi:hypothetical protein